MRSYLPLYLKAWGLTFVIAGLELVGSILSGSFALLADTLVGLGPVSVEFFRHRVRFSARVIEAAGGIAVSAILLFVGYHIIGEAIEGLSGEAQEHEVEGGLMFLFATLAAGVNYLQHRLLSRVSPIHRHAAHTGFHFHILTDLLKNIALPIIALAIFFGGNEILDIWAALVIGIIIILRAVVLILESILGRRILESGIRDLFSWLAK
jgi:cobalt-zinc-cadmium efflux system protein